MNHLDNFLERLTELLREKGINKYNFSLQSGCDGATIANWYKGKFYPNHASLIALADYFDCSVDFLLGLSDVDEFIKSKKPSDFFERYRLLKKDKYTDYVIAKFLNIQQSTISKWLLHGRVPKTETLISLSKLFNCSIEYLLGRADD